MLSVLIKLDNSGKTEFSAVKKNYEISNHKPRSRCNYLFDIYCRSLFSDCFMYTKASFSWWPLQSKRKFFWILKINLEWIFTIQINKNEVRKRMQWYRSAYRGLERF